MSDRVSLLTPISLAEIPKLLEDDNYVLQQKLDGVRVNAIKDDQGFRVLSRNGIARNLETLGHGAAVGDLEFDFVLDGELILPTGPTVMFQGKAVVPMAYISWFDILQFNQHDLRPLPYGDRLRFLQRAKDRFGIGPVVESIYGDKKRQVLYNFLMSGAEGVVFKDLRAPWKVGRSGVDFKVKFQNTATLLVLKKNEQSSIRVAARLLNEAGGDEGALIVVGDVTIPQNREVPPIGSLVEVQYLYATRAKNRLTPHLYQPVLVRVREDVSVADTTDSLYMKGEPR